MPLCRQGTSRVKTSQTSTPKAYESASSSYAWLRNTSGGWYSAVPPADPDLFFELILTRLSPKSEILALRLRSSKTLADDRSRWMIGGARS
eukprot:scaffold7600_cov592-Prasinococcus_capsulatus_cf.AAC.1